MKRSIWFLIAFGFIFLTAGFASAENLEKIADDFYGGMAVIIERNMSSPDKCVSEVEDYYATNQATVSKIREEAKKAMEKAAPMMQATMDKYMSMSEEELEALQSQKEGQLTEMKSKMSPGAKRYSEALEEFTKKHPMHAMKIASLAMQLVPMSGGM